MQKNYKNFFSGLFNSESNRRFTRISRSSDTNSHRKLAVAYKNTSFYNYFSPYDVVTEYSDVLNPVLSDLSGKPEDKSFVLKLIHGKNGQTELKRYYWKRVFDLVFSAILMLLGFPVFAVIYLITKFSSRGPVFFKQERIGRHERKFIIYKFRSMYVDAEKFGPQLSNENDPRITQWGKLIRRTRLDELPQFWNVLRGDMSVVGPRPERRHFVDKIVEKKPEYSRLHAIKPGITSLGQVHYGYAENVDQMCDRMEYDLSYLQNVNLKADINVIFRTVKVMVECRGK